MKLKFDKVFLCIFAVGIILRIIDVNWDQGFHLHPDERFLTMVGNSIQFPTSFLNYLNPQISSFNPTNHNFSFFVYGLFPLTINKFLSIISSNDTYNNFTIIGRLLSAIFDASIIILIFKVSIIFEETYDFNKNNKYLASFLYTIAVLPIQLSHFFTVDTFLNFFMFLSFYHVLRYWQKKQFLSIFFSSVALGLAISCKITAIFILPLNLLLIIVVFWQHGHMHKNNLYTNISISICLFFSYISVSYLILRLANPYMFATTNVIDIRLHPIFLESIRQLKSFEGKDVWFPPAVQWINKLPVVFSLVNLAVFGIGIPYFFFFCLGVYKSIKKHTLFISLILFWMLFFFLYQSTQFVKTMRYFIFLYPFMAIIAGIGLTSIIQIKTLYKYSIFLLIIIWPLAFMGIYTKPHSRVSASAWIYDHLPNDSLLLSEHWDDALPLFLPNKTKTFRSDTITIFDPDTKEKWKNIHEQLQKSDYIILSSNRAWASIPTVPNKYPQTSIYYKDLFSEKLGYKKIKEITSYPTLRYLGIPLDFPDDWSEEAFTVYDHPTVIIFKKI